MTLRRSVGLVLTLLTAIAVLAIAAMTSVTDSLRRSAAAIGQATESIYAAVELRSLLIHQSSEWVGRTGAPPTDWQEEASERARWISEIRRHVGSHNEHRLVERAIELVNRAVPVSTPRDRSLGATKGAHVPGDSTSNEIILGEQLRDAREALTAVIDINVEQARALEQTVRAKERQAELIGVILLLTLVVLLGIIAFATLHSLYYPLVALRTAIDRYRHDGAAVKLTGSRITELAEIEEAFSEMRTTIETQRQVQLRFVAGVAHDIRNPLSALQMALPLLVDEHLDRDTRADLQAIAGEQLAYLTRMITDLMDTTSIESGQLTLRTETHDLAGLVREGCSLHAATAAHHRIERSVPSEPVLVDIDRARIAQVLNNLLSNAIKYSPDGGNIAVSLDTAPAGVRIVVRDEGIGIDQDDIPRIFEPFSRTAATRRSYSGMGLGLSVSRKIIEAHGGDITVASTPGRGSTFVVTLPAAVSRPSDERKQSPV